MSYCDSHSDGIKFSLEMKLPHSSAIVFWLCIVWVCAGGINFETEKAQKIIYGQNLMD